MFSMVTLRMTSSIDKVKRCHPVLPSKTSSPHLVKRVSSYTVILFGNCSCLVKVSQPWSCSPFSLCACAFASLSLFLSLSPTLASSSSVSPSLYLPINLSFSLTASLLHPFQLYLFLSIIYTFHTFCITHSLSMCNSVLQCSLSSILTRNIMCVLPAFSECTVFSISICTCVTLVTCSPHYRADSGQ